MDGLIDYAGLFPPASLDLTSALDEYGAYLPSADSWMLGRFIIPAVDLSKLPILSAAWRFSVLGRNGKDADEFMRNLEVDLADIQAFRQTQPATTDIFEVRLPSDIQLSNKVIQPTESNQPADYQSTQINCIL